MAFNLKEMTVDYKNLMGLIPTERVQLAQSGQINDIISAMTPGQLVSMFPRYYRDQLPDVGQINRYTPSLDVALSGGVKYKQNAPSKDFYSPIYDKGNLAKTQTPEEKAVYELFDKAGVGRGQDAAAPGVEGIKEGRPQRMKMSYDAFTAAGFSHKQALALTAEVGRENGFQEKYMFGTHSDPYNSATNLGMLSMQGPRLKALKDFLMSEGRFGADGELIADQETMNAMARFYMNEMKTTEKSKFTDEFLANPDIDPGRAAYLLGNESGYIRWRYSDPEYAKHHEYRDQYYQQIDSLTESYVKKVEEASTDVKELQTVISQFEPAMIGQLDERLQKWYENASESQKQKFQTALERLGVEQFNEVMKQQPVNTATLQAVATTKELEAIGGDAIVNPNQSRVRQEQDKLAGTRKLPLQSELIDTMNYATQKISEETGRNIYMKTFSGGQAPLGSGGPRTGSTEHDLGGASDNYFIEVLPDGTERRLNMSNPEDKQLMYRTAYHFARAGGRSVGLESGYMGDESIHLGISRNNEDPTHHADKELTAMVDQGKAEFLAEAKEKGWDPKYGYKDFFEQEKLRRQEEYAKKIKEEAEAKAQASPVTATENQVELQPGANSAPALATGGTIPPGENIAGVNMDTGKIEFMANDRERIRVDPATLENTQQPAMVMPEELARLETPMEPQQTRNPQPVPQPMSDPKIFEDMAAGYSAMPPSQVRATNRAKLYGEDSLGVVNGHFA